MVQLVAGMKYNERFDILEVGTNKEGHEIRLLWDKVLEQFGVQNFDEFYYYDDKQQAVDLFTKINTKELWIVVVVDHYYPSVLHFTDENEARKEYERYNESETAVHLAKVEDATYMTKEGDFSENIEPVHDVLVMEGKMVATNVEMNKLNVRWL